MIHNPSEAAGEGYDPSFLRVEVPIPTPNAGIREDVLVWEGGTVLPYTHFSLTMSVSRRFAYWVAWNIDGGALQELSRANLDFTKDRRLPAATQVGNELYKGNRLDRGHLARRADLTWGSLDEAQKANRDSFRFTNIAPQMDDFNQSSQHGLWGRLEDALYESVAVDELRACVLAGPVFRGDDQLYRGARLPREYWKVLAYCREGVLDFRAFLLTQNLDALQVLMALDEFRLYQVDLTELTERTQLVFPAELHAAAMRAPVLVAMGEREPLSEASDITW